MGRTPLMAAVATGNKAAVTTLLNLNANPNVIHPVSGLSALLISIMNNNIELVEILLQHKANPNIVLNYNHDIHVPGNFTLLTFQDTYKSPLIVHMLLEYGADSNYQSTYGYPLHVAAFLGCIQCVEILLKFNADPNVNSSLGMTPLDYSVLGKHISIVHSLLQYNVNHNVNIDYIMSLRNAAVNCHDEIFGMILSASGTCINVNVTFEGSTLLILTSEKNCLPIVRLLFENNADPMVYNAQGYTSLHRCILLGYIECVKIHLEFGVDPNTRTEDKYGLTPLLLATSEGQLEIMKLLLNKNAKVNSPSCVKQMLPQLFNEKIYWYRSFSLVNMLYCHGVSPLSLSIDLNRIDLVNLLLEHGADPNYCVLNLSILGRAIKLGHIKIVEVLLKHNASVNGLYDVFPPLFVAINFDHINIVQALLDHGADINIQVKHMYSGATPLMLAMLNGNIKMIELLLMKEANPSITNNCYNTAIDIANNELKRFFGYSPLNIEFTRRYLMIKKLLFFYIQKQQQTADNESEQETDDESEQLLSLSETKHTHSNSSIYELVYEVEYILKNVSSAAIVKKIDFLRNVIVMRNYTRPIYSYPNEFLPSLYVVDTINKLSKYFQGRIIYIS